MRWADAEIDDDDDELITYQPDIRHHRNSNTRPDNSRPDSSRPDSSRPDSSRHDTSRVNSSPSVSKPLTGIMSQFVSFRSLHPLAAPIEPLMYKPSHDSLDQKLLNH